MSLPAYPVTDTAGERIPHPTRPLVEGVQANSIITTFDSGHEQRRKKGRSRRTFELTYPVLTQAAYQTLFDFFLARLNVESFTWIHPLSKVVYTVRFNQDTLQGSNIHQSRHHKLFTMSFKLIEVI